MEKATLGFHIYKIWQILKRFAGTFCRAQTLKLGGVSLQQLTSSFEAHFHRISEALFLMTHKDEWHYKLNLSRFRTHNNTIEDGEISFEFSFDVDSMRWSLCLVSFG